MNIIINKLLVIIIYGLLISFPLLAMEQVDDIPSGTYLIKARGEFLFFRGEYEFAGMKPAISKQSICTFEKKVEGYLIKNWHSGTYLYIENSANNHLYPARWGHITANSYFDIFIDNNKNLAIIYFLIFIVKCQMVAINFLTQNTFILVQIVNHFLRLLAVDLFFYHITLITFNISHLYALKNIART